MAPGSGPMEHLSGSRPLEHSVLDIKVGNVKLDIHDGPLFGSDRRWSYLEITACGMRLSRPVVLTA